MATLSPRMFLANEIRRLRTAKGMNRDELAKAVFVSESLVRSWERGRRIPQPDHLETLEKIFDTKGILSRLRKELINTSVPLEWFGRWPEVEMRATSLWNFETVVIPGLLQTEEYARAALRAAHHFSDVDEMVAARLARQKVLTKEDAPMFVALLPESILRHNVGGEKVMEEQLRHLATTAECDNVIIQVIEDSSPVCAVYAGPFVIASFDGGDDVAYLDNAISGEVVEQAEDVVRLRRIFDILRADALSHRESTKLILKVAEQWKQ
jgi:transcriptional regulator with XRE-family HTH domain